MFKEFEQYRSCFVLKEDTLLINYLNRDFQLIFVELPKFKKTLEELTNLAEKWIYFLKVAANTEDIPANLQKINVIKQAFEIAERSNLNELELEEIFKQEMYIQDQKGAISFAHKQGLEEGLEEKKKAQITLIKKFLQHNLGEMPLSIQQQLEQLSLDKLDNLSEIILNFNNWQELEDWLS